MDSTVEEWRDLSGKSLPEVSRCLLDPSLKIKWIFGQCSWHIFIRNSGQVGKAAEIKFDWHRVFCWQGVAQLEFFYRFESGSKGRCVGSPRKTGEKKVPGYLEKVFCNFVLLAWWHLTLVLVFRSLTLRMKVVDMRQRVVRSDMMRLIYRWKQRAKGICERPVRRAQTSDFKSPIWLVVSTLETRIPWYYAPLLHWFAY